MMQKSVLTVFFPASENLSIASIASNPIVCYSCSTNFRKCLVELISCFSNRVRVQATTDSAQGKASRRYGIGTRSAILEVEKDSEQAEKTQSSRTRKLGSGTGTTDAILEAGNGSGSNEQASVKSCLSGTRNAGFEQEKRRNSKEEEETQSSRPRKSGSGTRTSDAVLEGDKNRDFNESKVQAELQPSEPRKLGSGTGTSDSALEDKRGRNSPKQAGTYKEAKPSTARRSGSEKGFSQFALMQEMETHFSEVDTPL